MSEIREVTPELLRRRPLPAHASGEDKESRGRVLVVGGGAQTLGAVRLAGEAALRAGAGKVQVATVASTAAALGAVFPEARVFAFPETASGEVDPAAAPELKRLAGECAALAVGPGMIDPDSAAAITAELVGAKCPALLVDAGALRGLRERRGALAARAGRTVLTPHAGEMASCLGIEIAEVEADPLAVARRAAREMHAVVALKGGRTRIVTPEGQGWTCGHGNVGLATAGSGDALAGIVSGLLARGAEALTATLWGVWHGEAAARLARRGRPLGFLARELAEEVPAIMAELVP